MDDESKHSFDTYERNTISERRSQALSGSTNTSSAKSVSLIEQSIFSFLSTFRFETTSSTYSIFYTIGTFFFLIMSLTTSLPSESSHPWLDIVLSCITIFRTWGFRYIPGQAWYYIIPTVTAFEILMIAFILICYVLYNRGLIVWANRIKYIIYLLGALFTITLLPLCYGICVFFDCDWDTGVLTRDKSLQCWNFQNTGILALRLCFEFFSEQFDLQLYLVVAIPTLIFQILLSCFFVVISCEMDPKRRLSIFAVDENYILIWEIVFNALAIILQETLEDLKYLIWLRYVLYMFAVLFCIFLAFRFLPFYEIWINVFYSSILFARFFGALLLCVVFSVEAYHINNIQDWLVGLFIAIVVAGFIIGAVIGFVSMVGYQFSIIKIVQNQLEDFMAQKLPQNTPVSNLGEETEISVITNQNAKQGIKQKSKTEETIQRFLFKIQVLELAVKIQMKNPEFVEKIFTMAEDSKLNSARFQLLQGLFALYFSNRPGVSYMLLRTAINDWNPNPFLRITIWVRYHDVNSFFKNSIHNERVDKLLLSTKKLESQLSHELKNFFSLYIQKSTMPKIISSAENINYYFNTINNVYYNLTRNYKLSKVYLHYSHFVEVFEKDMVKAGNLIEYADILREEEEDKLKQQQLADSAIVKKKRSGRGSNRIVPAMQITTNQDTTPTVGTSSTMRRRNRYLAQQNPIDAIDNPSAVAIAPDKKVGLEDALQYELDEMAPEQEEESIEDSYRTMITSQQSQIPYYFFIIVTLIVPIIMILIIMSMSIGFSTSMHDLTDVVYVGFVPMLPLQFLNRLRMNMFYSEVVSRESIYQSLEQYQSSFESMNVDSKYWINIPLEIAYPLQKTTTSSAQPIFVYEEGSLSDVSLLLLESMQHTYLEEEEVLHASLLFFKPFLFLWGNTNTMLQHGLEFFDSYLNLFETRMHEYQNAFYSATSAIYFLRIFIFLITTISITTYLFLEKNRILQLFKDIPAEIFATAYRNLEKQQGAKSNKKVYGRANTALPSRVLIILIYITYIIFEAVYFSVTFGVFEVFVGDFEKDIGLIANMAKFSASVNQVNFISNELYFFANTSSDMQNTYYTDGNRSFTAIAEVPIPTSTEMLSQWDRIVQGSDVAHGLLSIDSPITNQLVNGIPCWSANSTVSSSFALFQNSSECGTPLKRLALLFVMESTQTLKTSLRNATQAASIIPLDNIHHEYELGELVTTALQMITSELIQNLQQKETFVLYAAVFAACLILLILLFSLPLFYLWNRVLSQTHLIRQLLLLMDVEALSNIPSIRDYIVHYRINSNWKVFKALNQQKTASIIQAAADAVFVLDKKCKIQEVNRACTNLTGFLSADLLGQNGKIVFGDACQSIVDQVLVDGKSLTNETEVLTKENETVPVRLSVSLGLWNDVQMVCIFARDISLERKQNELVEREKRNSENLLLNILPAHVAQRLKNGETQIAEKFENTTILFSDMCSFTVFSGTLTPIELIGILNDVVTMFDDLTIKHGLEKIKTIGDAYLLVGGLTPISQKDHPKRVVQMGIDMIQSIYTYNTKRGFSDENGRMIRIRVGINTGSISAGIIGKIKFVYDVFGDAINVASRMESQGVPMRVHISRETYTRVFDLFQFEERTVDVKGKGEMKTYLLKL